jgi:hypothetical protein
MGNVKTNVITVTVGATGTISESSRKYLSNVYLTGRHDTEELEKTALLGTAHIHFNMGNNVACII